jgi:hypothetical protein
MLKVPFFEDWVWRLIHLVEVWQHRIRALRQEDSGSVPGMKMKVPALPMLQGASSMLNWTTMSHVAHDDK